MYLRRGDSKEDVNYPWCVPIQRQVLPEANDLILKGHHAFDFFFMRLDKIR